MVTYTQESGDVRWKIMGCMDKQVDFLRRTILYTSTA